MSIHSSTKWFSSRYATPLFHYPIQISFGGIPNSRNVLFLQIFLKRATKPSAGNTSAGFPWVTVSGCKSRWTWPGSAPKPPRPSLEPCWTWSGSAPKPPRTFPPIFSGTLLNLTRLCKSSQTFSGTFGTFSGTSLNLSRRLHQCTPELFWAEDPH